MTITAPPAVDLSSLSQRPFKGALATFTGTVTSRPVKGRSPKGQPLVTASVAIDGGENIRIVGFGVHRAELLELRIGDIVEISGREENFNFTEKKI